MKKKSHPLILVSLITTITVLLPFLFSYSLKHEWLQFISGPIESWIGFWGSYIGAIIGSAAVFIVAKHQIKKQHEQQINDIQAESEDRKSTRLNSSHVSISYAVFCLKKKKN